MSRAGIFFVALLLCWVSIAAADVAVPPLTGRIVDLTGTLSADTIARESQRLKDLQTRKGSQVAVLIVPTTQPESIEQYSIRVADTWKVGRKGIDDGYRLEGALTDVTARRIIDEVIVPRFKSGDFDGGITAGITRLVSVIEGEPLPVPQPEASHGIDEDWVSFIFSPFGLLMFAAIAALLRGLLGRLLGSGATAGVIGVLAWFVGGSIAVAAILGFAAFFLTLFGDSMFAASQNASRTAGRGGYTGGGWSGGGWSGGGGGWSGGSGGGFSGGGGGFGG